MAKITIKPDFSGVIRKIRKSWKLEGKKRLKALLIESISTGRSPVKGKGRYERYSQSYQKSIRANRFSSFSKRLRPVNLKITGALHRSLKIRIAGDDLIAFFSDRKAKWHQKGEGNLPERRLLPEKNEEFSRTITKELEKKLAKIIKRSF